MCEKKCTEHCYDGDEYDRVRFLEHRNRELAEELRLAKGEARVLKQELNHGIESEKYPWWANYQHHRAYLMGKINRQAAVIRQLQKQGWQPKYLIKEEPYPEDMHLWEGEPDRVMSTRRIRRPPDLSLLEEG